MTGFWLVTVKYYIIMLSERISAWIQGHNYTDDDGHSLASRWAVGQFRAVSGWAVNIEGRENIPPSKTPYVIVANHESATDILAIYQLNIQFRWLLKDSIFRLPMLSQALRWADYVPIRRGDKESHQKALKHCEQHLKNRTPVLFFPEGTRSTTGSPKAFKTGAFHLAAQSNVPVLPIVLCGAGTLLQKNSLVPTPATIQIKILPATYQAKDENSRTFCERVRNNIVSIHSQQRQKYKLTSFSSNPHSARTN